MADSPIPCDLTGHVSRQDQYPAAHGGFSDVWIGSWDKGGETLKVAIKVLRPQTCQEDARSKVDKRLRRELRVWKELQHPNIVPLFGVVSDYGPYVSMVSPWMENGNLNKFLTEELTLATRFKLLCDVATGLHYLHSLDIIHGDLTGANILISKNGVACLSDFGLSTIIAEFQGTSYYTSSIHGNIRWTAPELYRIDAVPSVTFFSDVYSFGSVMHQVLSGCIPYHNFKSDVQVLLCLINRIRPERPIHNVSDAHWCFIQRCWVDNPRARPSITEVLAAISFFYRNLLDVRPKLSYADSADSTATSDSLIGNLSLQLNPTSPLIIPKSRTCSKHGLVQPVWAISPRVLLVDDDAVIQKLSSRLLRIFGCTIDVATDGVAAVHKMNTAIYDLVFMDIMMPRLDGISATCRIREFDSMTPIISMTSNSQQSDVQVYYTSGMNDVLCKPFGKEGILMILEKYLVHLKAMQALPALTKAPSLGPLDSAPAITLSGKEPHSTLSRPGTQIDACICNSQGSAQRSTSVAISPPLNVPGRELSTIHNPGGASRTMKNVAGIIAVVRRHTISFLNKMVSKCRR